MKTQDEILHKKGCYCMYYNDDGKCIECGVVFPQYVKSKKKKKYLK
ncbi:MAG: hypothetical protein WC679_12485 [Bacteroidales bacterium]|jgi:hypothetical protein